MQHVVHLLDSMGVFFHDVDFCKIFKSLTDQAYTWHFNLKPESVHHWEDLMSLFYTKFFNDDAKFFSLNSAEPTIQERIWMLILEVL